MSSNSPKQQFSRIGSLFTAAQYFSASKKRNRDRKFLRSSSKDLSADTLSLCSLDDQQPQPSRRITSKHSGRELELDDNQLADLSEHFSNLPDKYYLFEAMFLKLFVKLDPQVAIVFGMDGIPEAELRRKTPFRTHVCKFQRFITTVMDLLPKAGREEELVHIIRMVGRQHSNSKKFSFTASRWLSFKSALLSTFSKGDKDKFNKSWSILFAFIIAEMKDAYLTHIRHLRSSSLPHVNEELHFKWEFRKTKVIQTQISKETRLTGD